jgi:hypothetical protein
MTHSGVLATILSGLEPAVAIALACIPLMRPLFHRTTAATNTSTSKYDKSKQSGLCSKNRSREIGRYLPSPFTELVYDNDNSSEIQLQPVKHVQSVSVASDHDGLDKHSVRSPRGSIMVERKWEVRRD